MWYALCSVEKRNADCRVLCVQGRKAGNGSDEDADCSVFCVQENVRMSETVNINDNNNNVHLAHDKCTLLVLVLKLTVVCFVFRSKSEC